MIGRKISQHDIGGENIAARVVEPIAGSTGSLNSRPKDSLQRLRKICDKHGILLISRDF